MNIFLDDTRNPYDVFLQTINPLYEHNHTWKIIRDYDQFISFIINNGVPELISFDHDLDQSHYLPINQTNIDYDNMEIKCGYLRPTILSISSLIFVKRLYLLV